MIYANTTTKYPTHFIQGVQLIVEGRDHFQVSSENWPYPTEHRLGTPIDDRYYAEIWVDGMDWQSSYWVIEEKNLNKPVVLPFIIFEDDEERDKLNHYDFNMLILAALVYRRDKFWIKNNEYKTMFSDTVWPFIYLEGSQAKYSQTRLYSFEHASQKLVKFWMNVNFIPEEYREKNRNYRNQKTEYNNIIKPS